MACPVDGTSPGKSYLLREIGSIALQPAQIHAAYMVYFRKGWIQGCIGPLTVPDPFFFLPTLNVTTVHMVCAFKTFNQATNCNDLCDILHSI